MAEKNIIDSQIEDAYDFLKNVANLDIMISGNYPGALLSITSIKNNIKNIDKVIDKVFWKMINDISNSITDDDIEFITFKSYCTNTPSKSLIEDCFKTINFELKNKKSSNETTIYTLLESLKDKHNGEKEILLDTMFDIVLDYYSIVRS